MWGHLEDVFLKQPRRGNTHEVLITPHKAIAAVWGTPSKAIAALWGTPSKAIAAVWGQAMTKNNNKTIRLCA